MILILIFIFLALVFIGVCLVLTGAEIEKIRIVMEKESTGGPQQEGVK